MKNLRKRGIEPQKCYEDGGMDFNPDICFGDQPRRVRRALKSSVKRKVRKNGTSARKQRTK